MGGRLAALEAPELSLVLVTQQALGGLYPRRDPAENRPPMWDRFPRLTGHTTISWD